MVVLVCCVVWVAGRAAKKHDASHATHAMMGVAAAYAPHMISGVGVEQLNAAVLLPLVSHQLSSIVNG
jgi:hypothetical protein